jgi:hypothetical protein
LRPPLFPPASGTLTKDYYCHLYSLINPFVYTTASISSSPVVSSATAPRRRLRIRTLRATASRSPPPASSLAATFAALAASRAPIRCQVRAVCCCVSSSRPSRLLPAFGSVAVARQPGFPVRFRVFLPMLRMRIFDFFYVKLRMHYGPGSVIRRRLVVGGSGDWI